MKRAASVRPEPGSNSPSRSLSPRPANRHRCERIGEPPSRGHSPRSGDSTTRSSRRTGRMRSRAELRVTTGRSHRPASRLGRPTAAMHWLFMASLFRCQGAVREAVPGSRHGRVGMSSLCWGPPTPLAPSRLRAGGLPGGLPFQAPSRCSEEQPGGGLGILWVLAPRVNAEARNSGLCWMLASIRP